MSLNILDILEIQIPFVITANYPIFYKNVEEIITRIETGDTNIENWYDVILEDINRSKLEDTRGLKTDMLNVYESSESSYNSDRFVYYDRAVNFIRELQRITLGRYESLSSFFSLNNITVSQYFASLSVSAGYPISNEYIIGVS